MPRNDVMENARRVDRMRHAIADGENDIKRIPGFVKDVIETEAWRERYVDRDRDNPNGAPIAKHESFLSFINTAPEDGMGWSTQEDKDQVANLLRLDPDLVEKWRRLTTPPKHLHHSDGNNIPIRPHRGTSLAWTLSRLAAQHPDLYAKVVAKELSANKAAIQAGIRKPPKPRLTRCPHCGKEL